MDTQIDFGKIAFNAVNQFLVEEFVPDMVNSIVDDFVAGDGYAKSFKAVADVAGQYVAEEIFGLFLTNEAVEAYSQEWEDN